jgi:phosphopantothenoylcysteine decarboxylase/phosphopantothenate--cysteine ligase
MRMLRILLTAGPTHEPIDPVRYIGNRSSGRMGAAIASAALHAGHQVTLVVGPVSIPMPQEALRMDVQTSREMYDAVMAALPEHDMLIMSAAVADFRPKAVLEGKIERGGTLSLELEATQDILAAAGRLKRDGQVTVGFSLVGEAEIERSRRKLVAKNLDLIVHNTPQTLGGNQIDATLLYRDGRSEKLGCRDKAAFADMLLQRAVALVR